MPASPSPTVVRGLSSLGCRLVACLVVAGSVLPVAGADEPQSAARLLPQSVALYAEIPQPEELLELILEHPLRQRLEALPAYQELRKQPRFYRTQAGLALFEASLGMRIPEAVEALGDGGVHVAIDAATSGVVLLLRARDVESLVQLRETLFATIRNARQGAPDAVQERSYRNLSAYMIGDTFRLATFDRWLVVTNNADLGQAILDRHLDGPQGSLAEKPSFATAHAARRPDATAWGYVDVAAVRNAGVTPELYSGRTVNPLVEVLAGGMLGALQHTPYATATFVAEREELSLRLAIPHDRNWTSPTRDYFFGTADRPAHSPPLLDLDERLFAFSAHRDLSQAWLRAPDLLNDQAEDSLTRADTQLSTFFGGRDFGEEVLGAFAPRVQFIAARQDFSQITPQPAVKLPAFAICFQMHSPEETRPDMRRVFQSFIGFLNIAGGVEGMPQFDLGQEQAGDAAIYTATYVPLRDRPAETEAAINYNFSPAVAFAGDKMIVSSSKQLARRLVTQAQATDEAPAHNSVAVLSAEVGQQILRDNRTQLVAQNMLEKGHSQEAAEAEIDLLLQLVEVVRGGSVHLDTRDDQIELYLALELASPPPPQAP